MSEIGKLEGQIASLTIQVKVLERIANQALDRAINAEAECKSIKYSTHRIQYVPQEMPQGPMWGDDGFQYNPGPTATRMFDENPNYDGDAGEFHVNKEQTLNDSLTRALQENVDPDFSWDD